MIAIDKSRLRGEALGDEGSFYHYACMKAFESIKSSLDRATVVIDGSGSRASRRQLAQNLKRLVNDPEQYAIAKVKTQNSASNNLLQLADMIAGVVHRGLSTKGDADLYLSIVDHKQKGLDIWPK